MYRLLIFTVALMTWSVLTHAECREQIAGCESNCTGLENESANDCVQNCRSIVVCETERDQLPDSQLPKDDLPKSKLPPTKLPASKLPGSQLPESEIN